MQVALYLIIIQVNLLKQYIVKNSVNYQQVVFGAFRPQGSFMCFMLYMSCVGTSL